MEVWCSVVCESKKLKIEWKLMNIEIIQYIRCSHTKEYYIAIKWNDESHFCGHEEISMKPLLREKEEEKYLLWSMFL